MCKDATSYSRDDKERKPTTFEMTNGVADGRIAGDSAGTPGWAGRNEERFLK